MRQRQDYVVRLLLEDARAVWAWKEYCRRHLAPHIVFRLATGLSQPREQEQAHLAECETCQKFFQAFQADVAVSDVPPKKG